MKKNVKTAYNKLASQRCPVFQMSEQDNTAYFYIHPKKIEGIIWGDYKNREKLETQLPNGTIDWELGINPRIHRALKSSKLKAVWINPKLIGVYDIHS